MSTPPSHHRPDRPERPERPERSLRLDRLAGLEDSGDDPWVRDQMREALFGVSTPPRRIGRYTVERRLGRGGMGEVFVGHDEGLERRVALKLIKGIADDRRRARFLREGRALARLSHPNIVQVYEVGEHEDGLFIAMELVEGCTLAQWRCTASPTTEVIVAAHLEAGRGLAAAHAAGIVHRDFKPDNAMMGEDGRVRVLDFGLAGWVGGHEGESSGGTSERGDDVGMLTTAGALLGTPAYMAPEQHRGQPTSAATDQFALCVSLFEALHGVRPFAGVDRRSLLQAIDQGVVQPSRRRVPRRVRRALRRGLAADPSDRFATMDALLGALEARARPLRIAGVALVVGVVGGVALGQDDAAPPCEGFEREAEGTVAGLWDDSIRRRLTDSLRGTGQPHVESAWSTAAEQIERWVGALGRARLDACRAHHVREEESAVLFDLRMECLQEHEDRLAALLDELGREHRPSWARIEQLPSSLLSIRSCTDARALHHRAAVRPSGPQVERIDAELARASAQLSLGRYAQALATTRSLPDAAEQLGSRPVLSDVDALRGQLHILSGEHEAGIELLRGAARDAGRDARDRVAATRWWTLANLAVVEVSDASRGRQWLEDAEVSYERAGALDEPEIVDRLDEVRALLDRRDGDWAGAERTLRRRLARWRTAVDAAQPGARPRLERVLVDLASVLLDRQEDEAATAMLEEALAIDRELYGPRHPRTALVRHNLGLAVLDRGDRALAAEHLEAALEIWSMPGEDRDADLARVHRALTAIALAEHDLERARVHSTEARRRLGRLLPADHLDLAEAYNVEGVVRFSAGDLEGSVAAYRSALSIHERADGVDHIAVAMPASNLGESLVGLGRLEEALPLFDRAEALLTRQLGDDAADLAYPLKGRGLAWLGRGRPDEARIDLLRAWSLSDGTDDHERAEIALGLSVALRDEDPARAADFAGLAGSLASDALGRSRIERLSRILEIDSKEG